MGEITRFEHGLDNGCGIEGMTSLSSSHGKKAEGIGVEAVELALITEALDDGLGAGEARVSALVG